MDKNKIFSYVAIGCALLAILGIFLPYYSVFGQTISLWKAESPSRVLTIIFSLIVIVVYLFNKKTELSYLTSGALLFFNLTIAISNEGLDNLTIGFYIIMLSSIAIGVLTFLYNEKEGSAIINLNSNKQINQYQPVQPQPIAQPLEQPVQQPIAQPVVQPTVQQPVEQHVEPQVQNTVEQTQTLNFNSETGAPLNNNENNQF